MTMRRTHGATSVTVGKATGQVVTQLRSQSATKPPCSPRVVASTKAETTATMIADNKAPNINGARRAGIRTVISCFRAVEESGRQNGQGTSAARASQAAT